MDRLHGDFETRSAEDIRSAGAQKYAQHPTTRALCLGWAFNDEPVTVTPLLRDPTLPPRVEDHIRRGGTLVAHNAPFEAAIWRYVGEYEHGWPELHPWQLDCTMARAYTMGFPGSLDHASAAAGIEAQKDMKGHRLMLKLSQPRKVHPDGTIEWYEPEEFPEEFERLYGYCGQDLIVERYLDKRLLPLTLEEKCIWQMDFEINSRGVHIDEAAVQTATLIVAKEQRRLNESIQTLTNYGVSTFSAHTQLKNWIREQKVETEGVAKSDVTRLLSDPLLPPHVRAVLEVRQEAAKSSVAKLKAFSARACPDGKVRGIFQYYGAGTGRWSGRGIQPQNFPRPKLSFADVTEIFSLMEEYGTAATDLIDMLYGSPMTCISDCLRSFLIAGPGKTLLAADFSSIEARVLAWLAGEERVLKIFRTHGKIYESAAAVTFGLSMAEVTEAWRQIGKVMVLALGYQGGVGAFQTMAKNLGVDMAAQAKLLWARAPEHRREMALKGWDQRGKKSGLDKKLWIACELVKLGWREAHPSIVAYWKQVERAAIDAVKFGPGEEYFPGPHKNVSFIKKGSFLFCKLPSGRMLCYPYPEVVMVETDWGSVTEQLRYKCEDAVIHKWVRHPAYGGLLVENIVQAASRDLLAWAMLNVHPVSPVVLHCHDELVCEVDEALEECAAATISRFESVVTELPRWAIGLPMQAKGWMGKRYRK